MSFKIALVRLSAIGDCTLVLPVVRALLRQIPNAEVHWIIGYAAYSLLKDCQQDRLHFHPIDKPKSLSDYRAIKRKFSHIEFDALLAMQASTRANLIYPQLKAKRKIGFDKVRARELQRLFTNERIAFDFEHLHESFCKFAQRLDVDSKQICIDDWKINLSNDISQQVTQFDLPAQYIVINPAASKLERSWFSKDYAEIIDYLFNKYGLQTILTGGNASFEIELADRVVKQSHHKPVNLVAKTSLQQLAYILQQASLCIAPDTGPAHIANAMGCKVIGLYAVASSRLSGPYLNQQYTIDQFESAADQLLNLKPSQIKWRTRVHNRKAMSLIRSDQVLKQIDRILA